MIYNHPIVIIGGQGGYSLLGAAFLVAVVFCVVEGRHRYAGMWLWAGATAFCCAGYFFGLAIIASYPSGTLDRNVTTVLLRGFAIVGAIAAWMAILLRVRALRRHNGGRP